MLGKSYNLKIKSINNEGAFLESDNKQNIILPADELVNEKVGSIVKVFILFNEKGRFIATKKEPYIEIGELKSLEVKEITKVGIFLDWGLDKDLFLPFQEVTFKPQKGMFYLFGLYEDKSKRLCATMRIREFLKPCDIYEKNDWVTGTIYGINRDYGAFVAVDNKYDALIHNKDILGVITEGEHIKARVTSVTNDGKLNLSLRDRAYKVIDDDAEKIYIKLQKNDGYLPYNDSSNPSDIRREFGISKSSFKKAIGKLYKEKKIIFINNGIKIK